MRHYLKAYGIAALFGALKTLIFSDGLLSFSIMRDSTISLTYLILSFGLGAPSFQITSLINLTLDMLPLFLFQLLFGTFLYRHFCTASVYFFSRKPQRIGWFLAQARNLLFLAFLYLLTMLAAGICVASLLYPIQWDSASIILMVYYLTINTLWLFLAVLTINLVAIKLGSNTSFAIIGCFQLICLSSLILWKNVFQQEDSSQVLLYSRILQLNPISHLVLGWHSSFLTDIDNIINHYQLDVTFAMPLQVSFDLNYSVLAFLFLSAVLLAVGCKVIHTQDLMINNLETGGT